MWMKIAAMAALACAAGCAPTLLTQEQVAIRENKRGEQTKREGRIPVSMTCVVNYDLRGHSYLTYNVKTIPNNRTRKAGYAFGPDADLAKARRGFIKAGLRRISSMSYFDKTNGVHGGCEVWREP